MLRIDKHIEIVCSDTRGLSSMSSRSRQAAIEVLQQHYTNVGVTLVDTAADLERLVANKPDLVFLGMKFVPLELGVAVHDSRKLWVSDFLDDHGVIYTGSCQDAHILEFNKPLAKQRALEAGIATASFVVANRQEELREADVTFSYPVFIKPTNRGGGMGIDGASVAYDFQQVLAKVKSISDKYQADALIEEYLPGREFSVAILREKRSTDLATMPLELIAEADESGVRILSGNTKSANSEGVIEIADIELKEQISSLAYDVFEALGGRDYGRIDIRLDAFGTPHFLEANLLPSIIAGYGSFPKACVLNNNLNYESMILRIVGLALARQPDPKNRPVFVDL